MTAMMLAASNGKSPSLYDSKNNKPRLRCSDCKYCPAGNKTFCKTANHHTTKHSDCTNCKHYVTK